jgi:hypothetical protein
MFQNLSTRKHFFKVLYPIGYGIYLCVKKVQGVVLGKSDLGQRYRQLQSICLKNQVEQELIVHESQKYTILFLGVICSCMAVFVIQVCNPSKILLGGYELDRPQYGDSSAHYELSVEGLEEEISPTLEVEITSRQYTQEEVEQIFDELYEYLCEGVLGNNTSLESVTQDLNFNVEIPYEGVTVEWISSDLKLISEDGKILVENLDPELGNVTTVTANVSCGMKQTFYDIPVHLYPSYSSEAEKTVAQLSKEIQNKEQASNTEVSYHLPEEYDGKALTYYIQNEPVYAGAFLLIFLLVTVLLAMNYDFKLKEKVEEREKQMQLDYSEIVCKFTILIGAGMTIRNAWARIVKDYVNKKDNNPKYFRYAYEEMLYIDYRMQSGLAETDAYVEYGNRCHMHSYLKLSSIFNQNLIKGNQAIVEMLRSETKEAFLEHQHFVRRMGEKISTKLMVPMILSFTLVMVIIIFPAFLSMSIA